MYKVYCLKDENNVIRYVGQTKKDLSSRLSSHKQSFENRKNWTIHLIADVPTQEAAFILESMLINQYQLTELGDNKSTGYDESHITRDQYREDQKDKTNGFYKHKQSEHAVQVLSERSLGNQYAKGNKSRIGRKNNPHWHKRIAETKSKQVICIETGVVYSSIKQAAKELNLQTSKISNVCNGKRKKTGGLTFRFI